MQRDLERKKNPLAGRKFTAKVLSGPGAPTPAQETPQSKAMSDYTHLMELAFGDAFQQYVDRPPLPEDPSVYLDKGNQ